MGASGSGKSTLMNILGCLDRPDVGRLRARRTRVSGMRRGELARVRNRTLGFVFQHFNLLARTSALENVELPLDYAGVRATGAPRRATEALERVGLGATTPPPSESALRRAAAARRHRARHRQSPEGHPRRRADRHARLAHERRRDGHFQELWRSGITVVLVTHEPDVAAFASRVVVMRDGRVLSDQTQTAEARASRAGTYHT